jgi:predicted GNAT family acetyltransferase
LWSTRSTSAEPWAPATRIKGVETVPEILDLVARTGPGIRERGETPFLHAAAGNAPAIRLYESIGFTLRRRTTILQVRSPGTDPRTGVL